MVERPAELGPHSSAARLSARGIFFGAGFAVACWAPIIPFVKATVDVDTAQLGFLILCIGLGSIVTMPPVGIYVARHGTRFVVLVSGVAAGVVLPIIALVTEAWQLAFALFLFGSALGAIDVAMNVFGSQIEIREKRPLLSGFHAHFSIGGFCGVGLMTFLLSTGFSTFAATLISAAITVFVVLFATQGVVDQQSEEPDRFVWPRGIVLLLAILAMITFLVEGSVLEWGALLLIERNLVEPTGAGIGFMSFSAAMVIARLSGDKLISRFGSLWIFLLSGLVAAVGLAVVLSAPGLYPVLVGFILVGLGAGNIAPILISKAGEQRVMPVGLAVASIAVFGYFGHLMGPAVIGVVADQSSLVTAFWILTALVLFFPAFAKKITAKNRSER